LALPSESAAVLAVPICVRHNVEPITKQTAVLIERHHSRPVPEHLLQDFHIST
jgi:hypothetical protein